MIQRFFLNAKIHGATVTEANVEYRGSISVDAELLRRAGILPFEQVDVYNMDNGERLTTYAISGAPGEICLNGAAAHKCEPGQRVIIAAYAALDRDDIPGHRPKVLIMDKDNRVAEEIEYGTEDRQ